MLYIIIPALIFCAILQLTDTDAVSDIELTGGDNDTQDSDEQPCDIIGFEL